MTLNPSKFDAAPLSIVVLALNAEATLPRVLSSLAAGAVSGLIREVILSDGGSRDRTCDIALEAGARVISGGIGRGQQLGAGGEAARGRWLLFLHSDTFLGEGWCEQVRAFIDLQDEDSAAVFQLAFHRGDWRARLVSAGANLRTRLFAAPYGDQGLLISKRLYNQIGGYRALALFEDVDIIDRIKEANGRRHLRVLEAKAMTDPGRYDRDGYAKRVIKNLICLAMYRVGFGPERILKFYQSF